MSESPARQGPNAHFIAHLESGGAVLTATRRQARFIRTLYDSAQVAAGRRAWPSAQVMPLSAWVTARWDELAQRSDTAPALLSDAEAAWVWRNQADGMLDADLLDPADLAQAARRAWLGLHRHGGHTGLLSAAAVTRDQRLFAAWASRVESELEARGWLDPGRLVATLAEHLQRLEPRESILLGGFRKPTPAVARLTEALAARGWSVDRVPVAGAVVEARGHAAQEPAAEIDAMLSWVRARLQADPHARLALVYADLPARRAALERAFGSALQPDLELPGARERDRLFDFAGGPPLTAWGVAAAALACLETGDDRIEFATASCLLRSRYVGREDELEARVRLDAWLRSRGLAAWTPAALAAQARARECPALAESLESATRSLRAPGPAARADAWAGAFGDALAALGWPGGGKLGSDEYQAAQALRERLGELASIGRTAPVLAPADARRELTRLAQAAFQPERGEAPVLVFDALEAPGVEFDGLWVAGLTAARWPQPAAPDPFIPRSLQAGLGMPGASAAIALEEATDITHAWLGAAPEVIFSWPCREDDSAVAPSRILPASLGPLAAQEPLRTRVKVAFGSTPLSPLAADPAPPADPARLRGGSRILELQAKCPFRAFAELRLHAAPLEDPSSGVDARSRGLVLHRVLELIWRSLGSHAALVRLDADALATLMDRSLDRALADELPADLGARLRDLERQWQLAALTRLLEYERARPPFDVIATEEKLETRLAGLPLKLRIDRVDRIEAGLAIIDYKTGKATTSQWRGARPDAPQVPLYAVLRGDGVAAAAFASVSAHQVRLRGVAAADDALPDVEVAERFRLTDDRQAGFTWPQVREHWAGWLAALARRFQAGDAAVDPKQPQTCRYCHLETLCRVRPMADAAERDQDE